LENAARNKNDSKKFARLFTLQCILLGIMFLTIAVALLERPAEVLPMFLAFTLFLVFWFAYFYMTYFLGKRELLKYSPVMFLKYFQIPAMFLRQTVHSSQKYFFYLYIVSLCLLVVGGIWLWFQ
jgi:hypothetical protein